MDGLAVFNSIEAVFWTTIGFVVFLKSRHSSRNRRLGTISAAWFVLFGISDVFEVFTGAFWRPPSLFAFKACCVIALITCGIIYRNKMNLKASSQHPADESSE